MKVCQVGADLLYADGQNNRTKVTVAFHRCANECTKICNCAVCQVTEHIWIFVR